MIYLRNGYLGSCDDLMDSCVRASIAQIWNPNYFSFSGYEKDGYVYRAPVTEPANNKWNCTPDQIKMWLAATDDVKAVRRVFWKHVLRLGFSQDFQRDYPGTWKYPWPHIMTGGDPADEGKWRLFDFATPVLPEQWGMFIIKGKLWPLYPFLLIPFLFHLLALFVAFWAAKNGKVELNQLWAASRVYGSELTLMSNEDVRLRLIQYWDDRGELEYYKMIRGILELEDIQMTVILETRD